MKNIYILCIVLSSFFNTYAQSNKIDTFGITTTSKFILVLEFEKFKKDEQFYKGFMGTRPRLRFYKSKGIDDIVFYSLDFENIDDRNFVKIDSATRNHIAIVYIDSLLFKPIFGYNIRTNEIYRLKGFSRNDFNDFYTSLISQYSRNNISQLRLKKDIANRHVFVENLDLNCLKKTNRLGNRKKSKCLASPLYIEKSIGIQW